MYRQKFNQVYYGGDSIQTAEIAVHGTAVILGADCKDVNSILLLSPSEGSWSEIIDNYSNIADRAETLMCQVSP